MRLHDVDRGRQLDGEQVATERRGLTRLDVRGGEG